MGWWGDKHIPHLSSGQVHVFVKIPVRYHPQRWSTNVTILDAMDTQISRLLYRSSSAFGYNGYYDPELRTAGKDILVWYEGKTLKARTCMCARYFFILIVLFLILALDDQRERLCFFETDLHEKVVTEFSPLEGLAIHSKVVEVPGVPTELRPVSEFDCEAKTIEFPAGNRVFFDSDLFGIYGYACNWCLVTKCSFRQRPSYQRYALNKICRLALSRQMAAYYGTSCDVPVMNIRAESISEHPVVDDRFEIKLVIRAIDVQCGKLILDRLKEGAKVSPDGISLKHS
ncbi:hypothetical protein GN244_ATG15138 [Phytophthora infestans]|uniref:Uncharacterized protein n=1 Tax=Phytophthora infestans TaxID=4787 RepID=A0A833STH6_PHYIN|nr:hypothetical protein GN244_ATG15138 [Phytophthora infestans]